MRARSSPSDRTSVISIPLSWRPPIRARPAEPTWPRLRVVDTLLRLLELVRRELGADDAHLRLGGRETTDDHHLHHELRPGCRLVVRFETPPAEPQQAQQHLAELATAFSDTVDGAIEQLDATLTRTPSSDALTEVLTDLRDATGAGLALVIDRQSPVLWGCSDPALELRDRPSARRLSEAIARARADGHDPVRAAMLDPSSLTEELSGLGRAERSMPGGASRLADAVHALALVDDASAPRPVQPTSDAPGIATKVFGGLYEVVLVFAEPFSPLRVEGVLRRAVPVVERHVLDLPPLDPTPKGGRVVPLRRE